MPIEFCTVSVGLFTSELCFKGRERRLRFSLGLGFDRADIQFSSLLLTEFELAGQTEPKSVVVCVCVCMCQCVCVCVIVVCVCVCVSVCVCV